jgi:hypothetical protein
MANQLRHKLTIFDTMILVATAALGAWGAAAYKSFPLPIIARPGLPVFPLLLSVPVAAALTGGLLAVPARTLRERARRVFRQPGTALCVAVAAVLLGVMTRWSLRAWITPYVDGSMWIYGASILYEWAKSGGLGVVAAMVLLILAGRLRLPVGWIEWLRLVVAAYWLVMFLIFSVV